MTDSILIDYDAFSLTSKLYVVKNGKRSDYRMASNIESLASEAIWLALQTGIYTVKVHAPSTFVDEISHQIKQCELTMYAENKILVEGI